MAYCSFYGVVMLWLSLSVISHPGVLTSPGLYLAPLFCLLYLVGAVASFFLFRGAQWARRWLFIGFLVVVVIGWVMGQYDYARLVAGKRPVFAHLRLYCEDGGSVEYWGLGYTVTDLHQMRWGIEMQNEVTTNASYKVAPYVPFRVGPTLDYWTPFVSHEQTRFIVETNK
jgi:hypothetical protein